MKKLYCLISHGWWRAFFWLLKHLAIIAVYFLISGWFAALMASGLTSHMLQATLNNQIGTERQYMYPKCGLKFHTRFKPYHWSIKHQPSIVSPINEWVASAKSLFKNASINTQCNIILPLPIKGKTILEEFIQITQLDGLPSLWPPTQALWEQAMLSGNSNVDTGKEVINGQDFYRTTHEDRATGHQLKSVIYLTFTQRHTYLVGLTIFSLTPYFAEDVPPYNFRREEEELTHFLTTLYITELKK